MNTEQVVEMLASHRTVGSAPRDQLLWIAEHGAFRHFDQGEIVIDRSRVVDALYILLSGRLAIYMDRGTGMRRMMEWVGGDVTGLLPYSRLTTPPGDTIVEEPVDAVAVKREDIPALIRECHDVTAILVHVMTDRARRFTSTDLRDEKMISLGRLAAGLAHEINNPASAALRDAKSMVSTLAVFEEATLALSAARLTEIQLADLDALRKLCRTAPARPVSGLALADREDAFAGWLGSRGLDEALAADLARTPAGLEDLDRLSGTIGGATFEAALRWVAAATSACSLASDIERATGRIHGLVGAAKGFTRMDHAPVLEQVEIAPGLSDTVALLAGKARAKSIIPALTVPDDLPPVRGYAVEVNQVWMNLIDNAIDAAPEKGHVAVTAFLEGPDVIVTVADDGHGIPPEIRQTIFDPFFTTKPVGEGTGLGLDIVRRIVHWHNGEIVVDSRAGHTEFRVRLPVAGPG